MSNDLLQDRTRRPPAFRSGQIWIRIELADKTAVKLFTDELPEHRAEELLGAVLPQLEQIAEAVETYMRPTSSTHDGPWS